MELAPVCWISKTRDGVEHYLYLDPTKMPDHLLAVLEYLGYRFFRYDGGDARLPMPAAGTKFRGEDAGRYAEFTEAESEAWLALKAGAAEREVGRRPTLDELRRQRDKILKGRKDGVKKQKPAPVR